MDRNPGSGGSAAIKAKDCAAELELDWTSISSCFSGDEALKLISAASTHFDARFPGPIGVPHIEIDGHVQEDRSEASLINALCALGIKAGACNGNIVV